VAIDGCPIYEIQIANLESEGQPGTWQLALATDDEGGGIDLDPIQADTADKARKLSVATALRRIADALVGANTDIEDFECLKAEGRLEPR
jgi:hypothetical protein